MALGARTSRGRAGCTSEERRSHREAPSLLLELRENGRRKSYMSEHVFQPARECERAGGSLSGFVARIHTAKQTLSSMSLCVGAGRPHPAENIHKSRKKAVKKGMSHQHEKNLAASIIKGLFRLDPVLVRYEIRCCNFVLSSHLKEKSALTSNEPRLVSVAVVESDSTAEQLHQSDTTSLSVQLQADPDPHHHHQTGPPSCSGCFTV